MTSIASAVDRQRDWPAQLAGLALAVVLCAAAAAVGGWLTELGREPWYDNLMRPPGTPPNWVFGPVWTALYLAMAVAAWLVWLSGSWKETGPALCLFGFQLALNVAWSGLFFALRNPLLGLIEIVLLWLAIAATLVAFWRRDRLAGLLLAPYLAWVTYAAYLNAGIWHLNG